MESSTVWAIGFVALVTGSIMAVLLGLVLEYRLNVARISAGLPANDGELSRQRRVLGWGLGLLFGGVAILFFSDLGGVQALTSSLPFFERNESERRRLARDRSDLERFQMRIRRFAGNADDGVANDRRSKVVTLIVLKRQAAFAVVIALHPVIGFRGVS